MGGRLIGRSGVGPFTQPHRTGLEGGARVASVLAGMLLIGAGVLHISAAGDHTNLPVMTAGFLVVAALQAGLGGLILHRRPSRLLVAGGIALTLGAIATWLVSRTVGLPFLPGGHMEPVGFKDGITVLFEVATVPVLALLASADLDQVRLPSPRLGNQAAAVLGSAMFALFVPALMLEGGGHHSAGEMHAHGEEAGHAHGENGEELAHAGDGHAHADKAASDGHGEHAHGQPATAEVLANAHHNATGHAHDPADLGLTGDGHRHAADDHGTGGHDHGSGDTGGGGHEEGGGHGHGDGGDGHQGGGHGDDDTTHGHGDGGHEEATPAGNERALALESGHPEQDGQPAQGPALVFYDQPNEEMNGRGHAHEGTCEPTGEQQAAADAIVSQVQAELRQYENNPAEALADGFNYVFGPTDRMLHMVNIERLDNPNVLKAPEIESFIYYMTDTGFVPIGGMFVMPRDATSGPEPGGCLTQWHHHGGFVGRWATAGTSDQTPLMMHVFTYPGLDPWGHYNGRDLAPLWTPGRWIPSVCRSADDANNGCLP